MANEWQRMHGPADKAPANSNLVAHCTACKTQWQVIGDPPVNTASCGFCGAPGVMITIESEAPDFGGAHIV